MPQLREELFQIPLAPEPPSILLTYYDQRMRSQDRPQGVALIAAEPELNSNFFLHDPRCAHQPIKHSFQKGDRN
jgi:hypothetical protein